MVVAYPSACERAIRVTGETHLIAIVEYNNLNDFLKQVSSTEEVEETRIFFIIEKLYQALPAANPTHQRGEAFEDLFYNVPSELFRPRSKRLNTILNQMSLS